MNDVFKNKMESLSGFQLYKLIYQDFKRYKTEAIQAAKAEFEKRNFAKKTIDRIKDQLRLETKLKNEKQKEVLDPWQKILFFLFFWSIIPWYIAGTFRVSNYKQKYNDAWKAMIYGFFTAFLIVSIISLWMYISVNTFPK